MDKQSGYMLIRAVGHPLARKDGYAIEHRVVMCQKLGKIIKHYEHVHHLNGNKTDNRPENLMLVNATDHSLITYLEKTVRKLEEENINLKEKLKRV